MAVHGAVSLSCKGKAVEDRTVRAVAERIPIADHRAEVAEGVVTDEEIDEVAQHQKRGR